jgi:hypothetical protein
MAIEVEETGNTEKNPKGTDSSSLESVVREQAKQIEELTKTVIGLSNNAQQLSIPGASLAELIERLVPKKETSDDLSGGVTMDRIPKDDVMDTPVTYYAPLNGYVISGDIRQYSSTTTIVELFNKGSTMKSLPLPSTERALKKRLSS